jgi:hypothetical protein
MSSGNDRDGRDAQKHNQGREDVEGVRKPQRKANYAHGPSSRLLMTLRGAVALRAPCFNAADGRRACPAVGSVIASRDRLFRRTGHRRELARAMQCGGRTICDETKGLTAVNLAGVEQLGIEG